MTSFPIFESIEINPNLAINHRFWLLLREKFEKIRSDSESSCNFTSTCTKPKIENQFFLWFRAQYFQKIRLKNRYILGTFLIKSLFRPILSTFLDKRRVPSENIDDFPSIDLYMGGLALLKSHLRDLDISVFSQFLWPKIKKWLFQGFEVRVVWKLLKKIPESGILKIRWYVIWGLRTIGKLIITHF